MISKNLSNSSCFFWSEVFHMFTPRFVGGIFPSTNRHPTDQNVSAGLHVPYQGATTRECRDKYLETWGDFFFDKAKDLLGQWLNITPTNVYFRVPFAKSLSERRFGTPGFPIVSNFLVTFFGDDEVTFSRKMERGKKWVGHQLLKNERFGSPIIVFVFVFFGW